MTLREMLMPVHPDKFRFPVSDRVYEKQLRAYGLYHGVKAIENASRKEIAKKLVDEMSASHKKASTDGDTSHKKASTDMDTG